MEEAEAAFEYNEENLVERNWDEEEEAELAGLVDGDDESRHVVELPKLPTSVWKGYCFRLEPEGQKVYF